jgi:uncharacterized protein (DUF2236 family)
MLRTTGPLTLPWPLQGRLESAVAALYRLPGGPADDFARPEGEVALAAPDSLSWMVFKNPVTLFIGGVAAVLLELAEPRVRTGVWEHTSFRTQPFERMRRTAFATAMTVYGPRSRAEALIARVTQLHGRVQGRTPEGRPYRADEPELLDWVQATAAFGFLQAWCAYVQPLPSQARDRFYAEGVPAARLYGATGAPASQAELDALFDAMRGRLEPSPIVGEFLRIVGDMPALPPPLRPMQRVYIRAAVDILPPWLRQRLALEADWALQPWHRKLVSRSAAAADRLLLRTSPAVQACRRLGLPQDWLYRPRPVHGADRAQ